MATRGVYSAATTARSQARWPPWPPTPGSTDRVPPCPTPRPASLLTRPPRPWHPRPLEGPCAAHTAAVPLGWFPRPGAQVARTGPSPCWDPLELKPPGRSPGTSLRLAPLEVCPQPRSVPPPGQLSPGSACTSARLATSEPDGSMESAQAQELRQVGASGHGAVGVRVPQVHLPARALPAVPIQATAASQVPGRVGSRSSPAEERRPGRLVQGFANLCHSEGRAGATPSLATRSHPWASQCGCVLARPSPAPLYRSPSGRLRFPISQMRKWVAGTPDCVSGSPQWAGLGCGDTAGPTSGRPGARIHSPVHPNISP